MIDRALKNELGYSLQAYKRFKQHKLHEQLDKRWVSKKLYNALRYHDTCLQLLEKRTIYDFGRMNYVKIEINRMLSNMESLENVFEYIYEMIKKKIVEVNEFIKKDLSN